MTDYTSLPADLPVPEDDGAAAHLPGTMVPHLELSGTSGTTVRLDALGAGRTVLYIYPLTGRPGVDLPDGWTGSPGRAAAPPKPPASVIDYQDLLAAGAEGFSACPARTPTTSVRSLSGFTCRFRYSLTLTGAWRRNWACLRSRQVG